MKIKKIVFIIIFLNIFTLNIFTEINTPGPLINGKTRPFKDPKKRTELKRQASVVVTGLTSKNKKKLSNKTEIIKEKIKKIIKQKQS